MIQMPSDSRIVSGIIPNGFNSRANFAAGPLMFSALKSFCQHAAHGSSPSRSINSPSRSFVEMRSVPRSWKISRIAARSLIPVFFGSDNPPATRGYGLQHLGNLVCAPIRMQARASRKRYKLTPSPARGGEASKMYLARCPPKRRMTVAQVSRYAWITSRLKVHFQEVALI